MCKDVFGNGSRSLSEHIREYIVQFEVGDSETVLSTVLLTGYHIRQLSTVADQIAELTDIRRGNEGRPDHVAHEEITDPSGILSIGLVAFLRLGVFGVGKNHIAGLLKDIENRDPILAGRFHADIRALVGMKPERQPLKVFGERREASFMIHSTLFVVGNPNAGVDPGFVDIESTAVVAEDFEHKQSS